MTASTYRRPRPGTDAMAGVIGFGALCSDSTRRPAPAPNPTPWAHLGEMGSRIATALGGARRAEHLRECTACREAAEERWRAVSRG
jgi:hypothetical protein